MTRLLLVNHATSDLELSFPWARGPRQPTTQCRIPQNGVLDTALVFPGLPKEQARAVIKSSPDFQLFRRTFRVELVDEHEVDEVNRAKSRQIAPATTSDSVPVTVVKLQNGLRILPETDFGEPPMPPIGDALPSPKHPDTPPLPREPGVTRESQALRLAQEKAAAEAFKTTQARMKNGQIDTSTQNGQLNTQSGQPADASSSATTTAATEENGPAPTGTLEPGLKDMIVDTIPSTRWTQERLAEHAVKLGIDIKGLSKNAILRKIRGA